MCGAMADSDVWLIAKCCISEPHEKNRTRLLLLDSEMQTKWYHNILCCFQRVASRGGAEYANTKEQQKQ
jgi:hypothetical protein